LALKIIDVEELICKEGFTQLSRMAHVETQEGRKESRKTRRKGR